MKKRDQDTCRGNQARNEEDASASPSVRQHAADRNAQQEADGAQREKDAELGWAYGGDGYRETEDERQRPGCNRRSGIA